MQTLNKKVTEFSESNGGTHERVWREEKEVENDAIILDSQSFKRVTFPRGGSMAKDM